MNSPIFSKADDVDLTIIDDNMVLQRLLQLEENGSMIYDFYRHRENPDAFRCASLNFSYRIEDDEEFAKALVMYERLKESHRD